ncbi:hypothetical protein Tco_1025808 [Tanacetum coccineum]
MPGDDNVLDNSINLVNSTYSNKSNGSGPSDLNLVFGDPLFLHPNDTSGNPENYHMWNCAMKFALRNKNKLGKTVSTINYSSMSNVTNSAAAGLRNPSMALTTEHMLKLISLVNEKPVPTANSTLLADTPFKGENQHMIVSANFLINVVDVSNLGLTVGHPNATQALIIKIGDLKINDHITLYSVPVVPKYKVSLLSVHKLARDNNLFVGFDDHKCYIQDLKENKIVGIGNVNDDLYLFNIDSACKNSTLNCNSACYLSKSLWHKRLGHSFDQVLLKSIKGEHKEDHRNVRSGLENLRLHVGVIPSVTSPNWVAVGK